MLSSSTSPPWDWIPGRTPSSTCWATVRGSARMMPCIARIIRTSGSSTSSKSSSLPRGSSLSRLTIVLSPALCNALRESSDSWTTCCDSGARPGIRATASSSARARSSSTWGSWVWVIGSAVFRGTGGGAGGQHGDGGLRRWPRLVTGGALHPDAHPGGERAGRLGHAGHLLGLTGEVGPGVERVPDSLRLRLRDLVEQRPHRRRGVGVELFLEEKTSLDQLRPGLVEDPEVGQCFALVGQQPGPSQGVASAHAGL